MILGLKDAHKEIEKKDLQSIISSLTCISKRKRSGSKVEPTEDLVSVRVYASESPWLSRCTDKTLSPPGCLA